MAPSNVTAEPSPPPAPRLVAWEVTRRCNLACVHCRASALDRPQTDELTTDEGRRLLDEIASLTAGQSALAGGRSLEMGTGADFGKSAEIGASPHFQSAIRNPQSAIIVILTGGEPLLREDIVDLVRHGTGRGLRMVMAPNGTLLTPPLAADLRDAGLKRVSISLDAASAARHDAFRQVPGAFDGAMHGIAAARQAGLPFQVNSTLTKRTVDQMEALLALAVREGAAAWHVFLLVEIGRARGIAEEQMTAEEYEQALRWLAERRETAGIEIRATCAPHFTRILSQLRIADCGLRIGKDSSEIRNPQSAIRNPHAGCLAGTGFCFVSHRGILSPCGYLEVNCGDVRRDGFARAWRESAVLQDLRDKSRLKGKCGACEYRALCGGCRARAYAATGDYLAEEPCCTYKPSAVSHQRSAKDEHC